MCCLPFLWLCFSMGSESLSQAYSCFTNLLPCLVLSFFFFLFFLFVVFSLSFSLSSLCCPGFSQLCSPRRALSEQGPLRLIKSASFFSGLPSVCVCVCVCGFGFGCVWTCMYFVRIWLFLCTSEALVPGELTIEMCSNVSLCVCTLTLQQVPSHQCV